MGFETVIAAGHHALVDAVEEASRVRAVAFHGGDEPRVEGVLGVGYPHNPRVTLHGETAAPGTLP